MNTSVDTTPESMLFFLIIIQILTQINTEIKSFGALQTFDKDPGCFKLKHSDKFSNCLFFVEHVFASQLRNPCSV